MNSFLATISSKYQLYLPHYRKNIHLAYPIILSMAGQMIVGIADNLMVGRFLGVTPLAATSFANSIFIIFLVFGIGFGYGLTPLIGAAFGEKNFDKIASLFKHGLLTNTVLGILLFIGIESINPFLFEMGQTKEVVELTIPYLRVINLSIIPFMIFLAFKQFSEGVAITKPVMYCTLSANLVNIILNYILINGEFGFPALGLQGAAYATLFSRVLMMVTLVIYMLKADFFKEYFRNIWSVSFQKADFLLLSKVSFPPAFQVLTEIIAFAFGGIMVGWISKEALAAHQIVLTMVSLTFMMANGLASATTIRVSNLMGEKKYEEMKFSAQASFHLVLVFMVFTAIAIFIGRDILPTFFLNETTDLQEAASQIKTLEITAGLLIIASIFQISDGLHVVLAGALRGLKDMNMPMIIDFVAFVVVALPVGYFCAFTLELQAVGVWIGYLVGLGLSAILLLFRFRKLRKKLAPKK